MELTRGKIYSKNFRKLVQETKARIIVISGPSGVGKGTLVGRLLEGVPNILVSISATTRPPRPGERNGTDYDFVSQEKFTADIRQGAFLEWARVYDDYYGTPAEPVLAALRRGKSVILEIDVQGARQVKDKLGKEAVYIFIAPPSMAELEKRLAGRETESPQERKQRLEVALSELELVREYDYVIINDVLERAADELIEIVTEETTRGPRKVGS